MRAGNNPVVLKYRTEHAETLFIALIVVWSIEQKSFIQLKSVENWAGHIILRPGFHYTANATITTHKQSDFKVEQSSFTQIALFWLEIGRCGGRNWLNGNQA